MDPTRATKIIKEESKNLGFFFCGISKARFLEQEARDLEQWLRKGYHGEMTYMENHFDLRVNPERLFPGAKSVVSLALNYFPSAENKMPGKAKVSKYAWGEDYHRVIRKKKKKLLRFLKEEIGEIQGRGFVDSAPVMDKVWAKNSGLGWVGKNTNLINPRAGSFFFLAELVLDIPLVYDGPIKDYCGTCTRCIDACPTDALTEPYKIDARKCISYLTIELKGEIDNRFKGKMEDWVFGCDICQDVCPWNRFSKTHTEPQFNPLSDILNGRETYWLEISDELFGKKFGKTALKRSGLKGMKRNAAFLRS